MDMQVWKQVVLKKTLAQGLIMFIKDLEFFLFKTIKIGAFL